MSRAFSDQHVNIINAATNTSDDRIARLSFEFEKPTLTVQPWWLVWSIPTTELYAEDGPQAADVVQGVENNCTLLATLASMAAHDPDRMFMQIDVPNRNVSKEHRGIQESPSSRMLRLTLARRQQGTGTGP